MGSINRSVFNQWLRAVAALALVAVLAGSFAGTARTVLAQDKGEQPAGEGEAGKGEEHKGPPNMIMHILESAGIFFGPLLGLVSLALVALIVILAMELRMGSAIPAGFVDEFTDVVNRRQFKAAFDLCRNDNSFLARVLTAGMSRLQYGIEDARHNAYNMVDSIKSGKEQLI